MYRADTGMLLRFLLRDDLSYQGIRMAVSILKSRCEQLVTTPQNIVEVWNVCTRPTTALAVLGLFLAGTQTESGK